MKEIGQWLTIACALATSLFFIGCVLVAFIVEFVKWRDGKNG